MDSIGFRTRLCRPRHPWTKGKVERLIRFVKESFLQGREFVDITQPSGEAGRWCLEQPGRWRRAAACVPADEHRDACMQHARPFAFAEEAERWLCPKRRISFGGFASCGGRRFGVPFRHARRECRVGREGRVLRIYSDGLSWELVAHPVTWDRHGSCCEGRRADGGGPAEQPAQPPPTVRQAAAPAEDPAFARFGFGRRA